MIGMNTSKLAFPNRRRLVRVYYPLESLSKYTPTIIIHSRTYQVIDISENGIRFTNPNINLIPNGMLTFTMQFTDGSTIPVAGKVIRRHSRQIAIKLEKGIPYTRIMAEQIRLRRLEVDGEISYAN